MLNSLLLLIGHIHAHTHDFPSVSVWDALSLVDVWFVVYTKTPNNSIQRKLSPPPCLHGPLLACRYEAATRQRNHLLTLLNIGVVLYLLSALYIVCLYGRSLEMGMHSLPLTHPRGVGSCRSLLFAVDRAEAVLVLVLSSLLLLLLLFVVSCMVVLRGL